MSPGGARGVRTGLGWDSHRFAADRPLILGGVRFEGADSIVLLREVVAMLAAVALAPVHVDTTILMERPKIGPHRAPIRERLAAALGLDAASVNVKASTGEGMGFVGRLEGVAALAVVTVQERATSQCD